MSVVYVFMKNQNWGQKPLFVLDKSKLEKKRLKVVKKKSNRKLRDCDLMDDKISSKYLHSPSSICAVSFSCNRKELFLFNL